MKRFKIFKTDKKWPRNIFIFDCAAIQFFFENTPSATLPKPSVKQRQVELSQFRVFLFLTPRHLWPTEESSINDDGKNAVERWQLTDEEADELRKTGEVDETA